MFTLDDPRAEALHAVWKGRVRATAIPDGKVEWLLDDELPDWEQFTRLKDDGFITHSSSLPAAAEITPLGQAALILLYGSKAVLEKTPATAIVPSAAQPPSVAVESDVEDLSVDAAQPENIASPPSSAPGDVVTIGYYGIGPGDSFTTGEAFTDLVRKHRYSLHVDDRGEISPGEATSSTEYLSVVDPATDARMYVLYDDETWTNLESPGFVELLKLMDDYCRKQSETRIFMFEPETDEEEDELNLSVEKGHPFYSADYDFATGRYKR